MAVVDIAALVAVAGAVVVAAAVVLLFPRFFFCNFVFESEVAAKKFKIRLKFHDFGRKKNFFGWFEIFSPDI